MGHVLVRTQRKPLRARAVVALVTYDIIPRVLPRVASMELDGELDDGSIVRFTSDLPVAEDKNS